MEHNVLFDIEVYLNKEERLGGDWQSEIISRAFGSAFTNYFFSVNMQEIQERINKGFGFVEMEDADGQRAIEELNDAEYDGRTLAVSVARPRTERPSGGRGGGGGYNRGGGGGGRDRY